MKRQIEKNKANDFMKLMNDGETFQSSELKLQQGMQDDSLKGVRKRSNLICFLQRIKEPTIEIMQKYLNQNKNEPHLIKNKITLYQDITIIYEFRKYFYQIQLDASKLTQFLCSKLQEKIKRAKVTIRERIRKKLCHLNQHEIINAIRNKKQFVFDNKSKRPIPLDQEQSPQRKSNQSLETKIKQNSLLINLSSQKKPKEIKKDQTPIQLKTHQINKYAYNIAPKIYKYGSKKIKQPIYIHAKLNPKIITAIPYSQVKQFRNKYQFEECQSPVNVNKNLHKKTLTFSQQFNKFVQSKSIQKMDKGQMLQYLSSAKDKAKQILNNYMQMKDRQTNKDAEDELKKIIEKVQMQLQNIINQPQKPNQQTDSEEEQPQVKVEQNQVEINKELNQQQRQQRRLLFSVSNSMQAIKLLGQNQYRFLQINWSQEQDDLLYQYCFNNQVFKTQIKCLLRYKNLSSVIERLKFLIPQDHTATFEHVHQIYKLMQ